MTGKARLRVLIVDQSAADRAMVGRAVSNAGIPMQLSEATTLEQGLGMVGSERFDCVLLHWYLPDGEGSDFLDRLEHTAPDVPVIVLTSKEPSKNLAALALKTGAQDYLEKEGLDGSGLVRSIRYAVARKRSGELKAQLLHADRLGTIGQLAAGVAHEVNNPATWVMGNLSLLRADLAKMQRSQQQITMSRLEAVGGMLELVEDCQRGMERIVDTVRNLKRYAQPSPPRNDMLDLNAVVREAHRIARSETRHRAQIELVQGEIPPVKGDAGTLGQLVINLMINAAHALDQEPSSSHVIRITTSINSGNVRLTVEDSGPGVPAALQDRIFEPFFTTRTHTDGSGMGLAICRDIVRRHQGVMTVSDSALGGARFDVLLPCEEQNWNELETRLIRRVRPSNPNTDELRVLVVDDEPEILKVVTRLLSGCEVVTAGNGVEALARLREDSRFDGVLCDLMMPDMDGAELIRTLSRELPAVSERVVLCTGGAVTPQLGRFLSEAPCLVLQKPFGRGEMEQVVDHWRDLRY